MTTRSELLSSFSLTLSDSDGFLLPASDSALPDEQSKIIETKTSIDGSKSLEWHVCYFWDQEAVNIRNAHFWVINRGEVDEAAYWHKDQNPKPTETVLFSERVASWLELQLDRSFGTSTLRHIESIVANNSTERATATVIMETDVGNFVEYKADVWQNAQDEWQFKVIVT